MAAKLIKRGVSVAFLYVIFKSKVRWFGRGPITFYRLVYESNGGAGLERCLPTHRRFPSR